MAQKAYFSDVKLMLLTVICVQTGDRTENIQLFDCCYYRVCFPSCLAPVGASIEVGY